MDSIGLHALVPGGWSGDLRDFTVQAWAEDGDLAATVVVVGHRAAGWINLRHVHGPITRLVWLRLRAMAARTPPLGVIWADELAVLVTGEQAQEA